MGEPQIVVTKFTIPPTRGHLLPHSPLIASLNQSRMLPLVLLSASAGSGKTTLLAAWTSQHIHPVAWLSLDSLDNDPLHFWSGVWGSPANWGAANRTQAVVRAREYVLL